MSDVPNRPRRPPHPTPWSSTEVAGFPHPRRHQRPRPGQQPAPAVTARSAPSPAAPVAPRRSPRWMGWAFLAVLGLGGIAGMSAVSLVRIPNLPNCRAIFWPTASANTRLQCADAYADRGTVESLLAAIALVEALPNDHPLRGEINQRVDQWATEILNIAEQTFHTGELDQAIAIARQIPSDAAAADEVDARIARWTQLWEEAQAIFRRAENHLQASQFREAFAAAIQLRSLDNDYWSTTRYEALVSLITTTRREVNILANAERLAQGGSVDAVLEALQQVAAIGPDSYLYDRAQVVLKSISRRLLDQAEVALAQGDSAAAEAILGKIPATAQLSAEIADFRTIIAAYELTWSETTVGYEAAIARLQSIGRDRPLYAKAQALGQEWQRALQAVAQLNWAQRIAQPGSVPDLQVAIAEAEKIDRNNPFWDEAQAQIQRWREAIAEIEDRPFLDRAHLFASRGDRAALQVAIVEASNIPSSSALYEEAQAAIADWQAQIQTLNNRPILAQARQLAQQGQTQQAIAVASQIPPDEALYEEAQSAIADWQTTQQAQATYQQALLVAQSGNVESLVEAISLAQSLPETSRDWEPAQRLADQWSWELLEMAQNLARQGAETQAAAIAEQIPSRTAAYAEAQLQLRQWQAPSSLNRLDQ